VHVPRARKKLAPGAKKPPWRETAARCASRFAAAVGSGTPRCGRWTSLRDALSVGDEGFFAAHSELSWMDYTRPEALAVFFFFGGPTPLLGREVFAWCAYWEGTEA